MDAIAQVQTRKQEQLEDYEDDEWGDIGESSKFKIKKDENSSYYNCTTGTDIVHLKSQKTIVGGSQCYPLFIGGASMPNGQT